MAETFPVAIDDHEYLVDLAQYETASIEPIRQQADASLEFGEQSLNPRDLWRRSVDDWRFGSDQRYLDKGDAERARFHESRGVNPWERGELSLLPDTELKLSQTWATPQLIAVGSRLYVTDGLVLRYTTDLSTWTATAPFPSNVVHMSTDGHRIYCMTESDGIHTVAVTRDTPVLFNTIQGDKVWYVMGRLIVAAGPNLYNITDVSDTTAPAPLTASTVNAEWQWVAAGEGGSFIFVAGFSGDTSLVYRLAIRQDGTELGAPVVAAPLPDGEICRAIQGYVGVVALGTSKGVRLAIPTSGHLEYGPLAEAGNPVECFEPQGRFLWYGLSDIDGSSTGLGRMDLSTFLPERGVASPYAPDLMAADQGVVRSVATFLGKRVFSVDAKGVYAEGGGLVASGWVSSGRVTFNLPEEKAFEFLRVRHDALPAGGTVNYDVEVDDVSVSSGAVPTDEVDLGGSVGDFATVKLTLSQTGGTSPVVTRWTLRANPHPRQGTIYNVPLILREDVTGLNGRRVLLDPEAEYTFLLARLGTAVTYREGERSHRAYLDGVRRGPELSLTKDNDGFQGIVTVRLRVFDA